MHTNSLLDSPELGSRGGKFECMPEMVAMDSHCPNQIQMKARKQAHFDLLTGNAGSSESSRACSRLPNTFGALKSRHGCCFCICDL